MSRRKKIVGAAVLGGLVGAVIGLLLAPAPGRETRRRLARKISEEKEALLRNGRKTLARFTEGLGA